MANDLFRNRMVKIIFWVSATVNSIQVIETYLKFILTTVFLILSAGETCDVPLRYYLIVYDVLIGIHLATLVYEYKNPYEDLASMSPEARRVYRLGNFVTSLSFLWFLFGAVWVFSADTCRVTSPKLYYLSLGWVVYGFFMISLPLIICLCIIFCLPCVIFVLRWITPEVNHGVPSNVLRKIPIVIYNQETTDIPLEDAMCSICLAHYEENEQVRVLPCKHNFHKNCVDEWLKINSKCPLCMQSIVSEEESNV